MLIMKKVVIGVMLMGVSVGAMASWSNLLTMGNKTIKPTVQYDMETAGWDARAYEFTPAYNNEMSCIFIATEGGNGGLTCYNKGNPNMLNK